MVTVECQLFAGQVTVTVAITLGSLRSAVCALYLAKATSGREKIAMSQMLHHL